MVSWSVVVAQRDELHASHSEPVPRCQSPRLDPLAIDERAVGAVEISDLEAAVGERGESAVDPGDEVSVHDEVSASGASYRPDAARQNAERVFRLALGDGSQNPHTDLIDTIVRTNVQLRNIELPDL